MPVLTLVYHRVTDDDEAARDPMRLSVGRTHFARQMEWLARAHIVLPLDEALTRVRSDALTVAITFDDAYSRTLRLAADVLDADRLTATVFAPPGHIDEGESYWWDALWGACRDRFSAARAVAELDARSAVLMRSTARDARRAVEDFAPDAFNARHACELPATWAELSALPANVFSFGVHGEYHDCFAAMPPAELRASLKRALERLRAQRLHPIDVIAYPYGFHGSVTPDQLREVVPCWFRWGLSTCRGLYRASCRDPRWLPRYYAEHWDADTFAARVSEWVRAA
ncbi:MAG TPA: polysaccharide deacetylase family protein [Gemmatimonadaceae bacterium]|jgi:peptidoglycan/xylan/chitin deacetylase (PgdA/CDA1 family)|nr:polysaccharide deacetylase family protein [Gemmatimonadaceae bacterium]